MGISAQDSAAFDARIEALLKHGMKTPEIAERLGVSRAAITKRVRLHGLRPKEADHGKPWAYSR